MSFHNTLKISAVLGLATIFSVGSAHAIWNDPDTWRRTVVAEGCTLEVEVVPDWAQNGSIPLEVKVHNTSDGDMLLPGGEQRNGLAFYLTTEDGEPIYDRSEADGGDVSLGAGETRAVSVDLAKHPLYLPSEGYLEWIVELDGVYDERLSDEPFLWLHVRQQGDGEILEIDPIPVTLDIPVLLNERMKFRRLHAEPEAQAMIWDPTLPITPTPGYAPGSVIVGFHKDVDIAVARGIVAWAGYDIRSEALFSGPSRTFVVEVPEGEEKEAVKHFRSDERVNFAELDVISTIM